MPARTLEAVSTCQKTIPSRANSKSLRATIPAIVVQILQLEPGEKIRWVVETSTGGVTVRRERR
ncbi:MAG: hypothetical protein L3K18_08690 [Thermoplasmata archaeon]|nr:hypothetical protein [Thermoplasmata archaeon]